MLGQFPKVYQGDRWLHSDWEPQWPASWPAKLVLWLHRLWLPRYIPRRLTGLGLPMPPHPVWTWKVGESRVPVQDFAYPMAPDADVVRGYYENGEFVKSPEGTWHVMTMHPVHDPGQASLQSVYVPWIKMRVPCYLSISLPLFGRRLHFNGGPLAPLIPVLLALGWWKLALLALIGCKPDVTPGDWFWWFEASFSFIKIKGAA